MLTAEAIAQTLETSTHNREGQLAQIQYRIELAAGWALAPGARLLEIACGQGDMTAVLAAAVGPTGHVTAVDIADPATGAPVTIGASLDRLLASHLESRIDVRVPCDLLDPTVHFDDDAFDGVVLAHGAWYFADLDQLRHTLERVRPWACRLYVAEWDLIPTSFMQVPHLLAVLIQGQVAAYDPQSQANVRSPCSRTQLLDVTTAAGWRVATTFRVPTDALQDAAWEIELALTDTLPVAAHLDLPRPVTDLLASQVNLLRALIATGPGHPLPSYAFTADRHPGAPGDR